MVKPVNDNRPRSWLSVLAIAASIVVAGLVAVMAISLVLDGGGVDKIIDMLEHSSLTVIGILLAVIVFFAAFLASDSAVRIFGRIRGQRGPNNKKSVSRGAAHGGGLFLIVTSLLFIAILSALGRYQLAYDTIRVVIVFAALCLMGWCVDRVRTKKRRWRESGRRGHWWDQK